jgi:hypothetical protein
MIERDNSHIEQVERWAKYVRDNPFSWKKQHSLFIDSQLNMALSFFERLSQTEEGRKVFSKLMKAKIRCV